MRWTPGGVSGDIEDRRDEGGGGGFGFGGRHIGIGGFLVLLVLSFVFKRNLFTLLDTGSAGTGNTASQPDRARDAKEEPTVEFVSFVLDDAQKHLGPDIAGAGRAVQACQACSFSRRNLLRVRISACRNRSVLLPNG